MYNQTINNVRAIVEDTEQKLQNVKKNTSQDLEIRTSAMRALEHEAGNYNAVVNQWNLAGTAKNNLKTTMGRIISGALNGVQKSEFGSAVILDDRHFENCYGEQLRTIKKLEPKA